jgi:DnaK suppressor protein
VHERCKETEVSTKKPARKAATAPTKTKVGKAAASAKPAAKTPAKAAAKPAPKVVVKPATKATAKPAPKPSARPGVKPSAPASAKPSAMPARAAAAKPAATSAARPASSAAPAAEPGVASAPKRLSPSARSKASAKAQAAYAAPAPMPAPTSRFADRFAPPRPPTRQMSHLEMDSPKQAQKFDPRLANAWKSKSGRDLTEAELLAMPEAEYMNDKQLEYFRATLQRLKDDLLSNAGETTEHLREDTSIVPDPADRATIEEEHALELRTRDRERKLLKKISQSLARIEAGDYGFCDETGEPIGLGRLLARPTATLSLEAQQRRELKQKMFGD